MRRAHHGTFHHPGNGIQHRFHFRRVDIEPAADDEILRAARDEHVPPRVDIPQVAGDEETVVPKFLGRFHWHAPVPGKHIRPAYFNDADGTGAVDREVTPGGGVRNAYLHAGQGRPHAARYPLPFIRVRGVHVGLGHAIAFKDGVAGTGLEGLMGLGGKRRGTGDEQAHASHRVAREPGLGQQPRVERRHTHQHRRLR